MSSGERKAMLVQSPVFQKLSRNPFAQELCLQQPYVRFPVEISGLTDLLLLYDLRSGLGDAAFYEISLNFEFLMRAQVHHGIEGQVAG
jgi:hypothetical protein